MRCFYSRLQVKLSIFCPKNHLFIVIAFLFWYIRELLFDISVTVCAGLCACICLFVYAWKCPEPALFVFVHIIVKLFWIEMLRLYYTDVYVYEIDGKLSMAITAFNWINWQTNNRKEEER